MYDSALKNRQTIQRENDSLVAISLQVRVQKGG